MTAAPENSGAIHSFSDTVRGRLTAGVLLIEIDHPPVNALSVAVRSGLLAAMAHAVNTSIIAFSRMRRSWAFSVGTVICATPARSKRTGNAPARVRRPDESSGATKQLIVRRERPAMHSMA